MSVTAREWAAVAVDLNTTVEKLQVRIGQLDDGMTRRYRRDDLPDRHYDRDLDPITAGQWAYLYEARSYRVIASTTLPNWYWIVTVWRGVDLDLATRAERDGPLVMETTVFQISDDHTVEVAREYHASLAEARERHHRLASAAAAGEMTGVHRF